MLKRRIFLALSLTAWIATSSFATPQPLSTAAAAQPALDSYVSQMWDTQQQLVGSLSESGLINAADQHDPYHDHGTGMGGEYGNDMLVWSESSDDTIKRQIDQISRQGQQEDLGRLSESLSTTRSYFHSKENVIASGNSFGSSLGNGSSFDNSSINIGPSVLAVEPIANARKSSNFGYRTMGGRGERHPGIDLAAPTGTPIYATGDGTVIRAGWVNGYGNLVEIDHGNGYVTRYGHASRIFVSVGDHVNVNQNIAAVGCTGRCTGPHLHYEVLKDGRRENPAAYLALAPKRES